MPYLLNTNVISELRLDRCNPRLRYWASSRPSQAMFISALTIGEVRKGTERMPPSARRAALERWLDEEVPAFFENRILPLDRPTADRWGRLMAQVGRTLPAIDSLIAATALQHGLTLVSRNLRDFHIPGLDVFDPWQDGEPPPEVHEARPRRATKERTTKGTR